MFGQRDLRNAAEQGFAELAFEKGWLITKRGWPDFFCFDSKGRPFVVEVKPRTCDGRPGRLKPSQSMVMRTLSAFGIRCFVSDGSNIEGYEPDLHDPKPRKSYSSKGKQCE